VHLSPWIHRFQWFVPVSLLWSMVGCTGDPEPTQPPNPVSSTEESPVDSSFNEELDQKLAAVRRQLIIDRGALEAESQNEGNGLSAIEKHELTFKGLHVPERIPELEDKEGLAFQLIGHCKDFGFVCELKEVQSVALEDRKVPDTIQGPTKVVYTDDQVRGVVKFRVEMTPIEIGRMQDWLGEIPRKMARLIHPLKAYARDKKMVVEAEAYWFLPLAFPEHQPEIRSLEQYLRAAGIDDSVDAVKKEAREKRWKEIEALHQEMEGFRASATKTLTLYAKGNAIGARWSFFRGKTEVIEKTTFLDIFQ
jgi:hypothetical protein